MELRMRDLDQIEEQSPEESGRNLGTIIIAAVVFLGFSGAVGVVVGRAAKKHGDILSRDPLSALEANDALLKGKGQHNAEQLEVNPVALNFPQTLTGNEERPEVLAALAAAAREVAELSELSLEELSPDDEPPKVATAERLAQTMPAAVSAGPARRTLVQQAPHDPLVEAAIPMPAGNTQSANTGHEGDYTLQVTSFDDAEEARIFAAALRRKGHRAFIAAADVPERGRYYRVRIGPFPSALDANHYRALFERAEQMNTFVVRRDED